MSQLTVRAASPEDALSLASRLRKDDLKELKASLQPCPLRSLLTGIRTSRSAMTIVNADDVPVAIYGVIDMPGTKLGLPWMLAADEIEQHQVQFLRNSKQYVADLQSGYSVLATAVYEENTMHVKWLQWCGFQPAGDVQINGNRFLRYVRLP